MVKKRGLGKSLDALLAYSSNDVQTIGANSTDKEQLTSLAVKVLQPGKYQPRREMDQTALEELAHSIRQQGIIQPLIVRPVGDVYEIIAGERRFRAAQLAGLSEVPTIIRDIPDETAIAIALIENIQREDLNPIEESIALKRLIEEFGMTHQQVAEAVGKSRASVTNLLRLLQLPEDIKRFLEKGQLEMGHARSLLTLPEPTQLDVAKMVIARGLSVREAEQLVRRLQNPDQKKKEVDPDILHIQDHLSKQFKTRVAIQCNAKGKGKLIIHYKNRHELNELISNLNTN